MTEQDSRPPRHVHIPMRLIDAASAADYLRETGRLDPDEKVQVTELTGGVSNVVLLVERASDRPDFVVKQARGQLRVAQPWFCSVERIWREVEVLRICQRVLASGDRPTGSGDSDAADRASAARHAATPRFLFADDQNYLFAMSAAPPHQVWKHHLLAGHADPVVADACGDLLGRLHAGTWRDERLARELSDRTFFEDLRIDPYYRHVAACHPALQPPLERLVDSIAENCLALVHGDFSPKNLLVFDGQIMLVDFEVGHFGDPAFDLGFLLSHLVLKALRARLADGPAAERPLLDLTGVFWAAYRRQMTRRLDVGDYDRLVGRAIRHFAGCALARVDGKSPVDYLQPETQGVVRKITTDLLAADVYTWDQVLAHVRS